MTFRFGGRSLALWRGAPVLMGILNVTPDSFSDGGRYFQCVQAIEHAKRMVAEGAAILDVGGESTRPGFTPIPAQEEIRRVVPVIRKIREFSEVPISIDTSKAAVAKEALAAGADMVNDVSALADPAMPEVIGAHRAGCILMHSSTLPLDADAPQVVTEWLSRRLEMATHSCQLPREFFLADPGIGFGKTVPQNLSLMANLNQLADTLPVPILLAMSRKSFIGAVAKEPDPTERLPGTIAAAALTCRDCHLLRVHDVGAVRQALAVAAAITECRSAAPR
ncbi:MAG: dihydropteroate synthase [Victivallales bacterium]|nr:dihydropteroate synthase [Victivallales bacterium]